MAVAADRERSDDQQLVEQCKTDAPAIGQHEDVAPHLAKEDLAQRDAVAMITAISVKHEHSWSRRGELTAQMGNRSLASMDTTRDDTMTYLLA